MNTTTSTKDRELSFTRTFNAPRELVWEVWTNPEHIKLWWGPTGFTNTIHEMSVKAGGVWRFMMHGPDGVDYPNKIEYSRVVKPERLEFKHSDDTENGRYFNVVVTFEDRGGKTELTMSMVFPTKEERDLVVEKYGAVEGNKQTMDRLENYLQKMIALS